MTGKRTVRVTFDFTVDDSIEGHVKLSDIAAYIQTNPDFWQWPDHIRITNLKVLL